MKKIILILGLIISGIHSFAQIPVQGKIFDAVTHEPLAGAVIQISGSEFKTTSGADGKFSLMLNQTKNELLVSFIGYQKQFIKVESSNMVLVALLPQTENLQTIVVTANREAGLRTETPVAISKISSTLINDTKPSLLVELINKVPGVVMLNYNNEQHGMGIRQPFGTSAYFLYMEDGLPLRPLGVFNHNALIEMNMFAISSVEVVKGPASSMYGAEAVGGAINFITQKPTAVPTAKAGIQFDNYGYKRVQWNAGGYLNKKLGISVGGYAANQVDSWQPRSDYTKFSLNARSDYQLNAKTNLIGNLSTNAYDSQTGGSVDSVAFYARKYLSNNDFTYRKVNATRGSLKLVHNWNNRSNSSVTAYYRNNAIGQNPSYSIRWTPGSTKASGEINENSFKSLGILAQHSQHFDFLNARLLAGTSFDRSPNKNWAYKTELNAILRNDKKSVEQYTLIRELPDAFLVNYDAKIYNSAAFAQLDFEPVSRIRISLGGRYDRMSFDYDNFLDQTKGNKSYDQFTPKIGLTADLGRDRGLYTNFSKGFSPPGLSAIFRKKANTLPGEDIFYYNLNSAVFQNFEIGGWAVFLSNKIYIDWAIYKMNGNNELLNIRQPDGSTEYQSAGKTLHKGIEYSIAYKPNSEWFVRFGGTNSLHRFVEFTLSNRSTDALKNVNGYMMPQAPKWMANSEVIYKPAYLKGFRAGVEWQAISSWYQNQINTIKYDDRGTFGFKGVSVLNFRTGYEWKGIGVFVNVLNLSNQLYASAATRGNNLTDRTNFTPSTPRTITTGIQYNFIGKK